MFAFWFLIRALRPRRDRGIERALPLVFVLLPLLLPLLLLPMLFFGTLLPRFCFLNSCRCCLQPWFLSTQRQLSTAAAAVVVVVVVVV